MELIKPRVVQITDIDGVQREFTISRLPALQAREVIAKYPLTNLPKLGDYLQSEQAMLLLMSFVGVTIEGREGVLRLETKDLVNNHVPDAETLIKLEIEMLKYNTSFFGLVGDSDFVEGLIKKYLPLILQTLTETLPQLSPKGSPASTNSAQSTT